MTEHINGMQKNIFGIGKIMIHTTSQPWNIPQLHFIVDKAEDHFEATCLEFGNVTSGDSPEEAAERLVEHLILYIHTVIHDGGGYDEFKELALNGFMNDYWAAYRHIEFTLAETKQDISHEIEGRIMQAIHKMFDNKIKELIITSAKEAAGDLMREYEKIAPFKISTITYKPVEQAA